MSGSPMSRPRSSTATSLAPLILPPDHRYYSEFKRGA